MRSYLDLQGTGICLKYVFVCYDHDLVGAVEGLLAILLKNKNTKN